MARPAQLAVATAEYTAEREPIWSSGWCVTVDGFFAHRVLPHFGSERVVSTITRADVERFRSSEMGRPGRGGKPPSNAAINRLMAALAAFGEWCMVEGRNYATTNPWAGHDRSPRMTRRSRCSTRSRCKPSLRALEGPSGPLPSHGTRRFKAPCRAIVEFARETGLRRGELGRVALADIDRRTRTLYVISTRARGRTKSRKMRPIPLSSRAVLIDAQPQRDDGLLFGPIPDPRRAFRTAAKTAGLERVWLHLFRHLFASRLAERGAGRAELREAGGWSSSRMADRYTHARMDRLRDLIEGGTPQALAAPEKATGT